MCFGEVDLFGDPIDSEKPAKQKTCDLEFWTGLHAQVGDNTLGNIILGEGLQEELKLPGSNNGGLMYVCAEKLQRGAHGYHLTGTHSPVCDNSVPVYWMPWKSHSTVYAERAWFERSKCAYFMTSQLTGCRFVVTDSQVLHVASNVDFAPSGVTGSPVRDQAEQAVTGGARSRRFSINGREQGYNKCALAFGMRKDGIWTYKALKYKLGDEGGEWVTLITGRLGS